MQSQVCFWCENVQLVRRRAEIFLSWLLSLELKVYVRMFKTTEIDDVIINLLI